MMKQFSRKVLSAAAPVFGVNISIAVLHTAHLPFFPALSAEAWPQWAVLAVVVYTSTSICIFVVGRIFKETPMPGSDALKSRA